MSNLRNKVILIGNLGNDPMIKTFETSDSKVANFTLATNEYYKNSEGEKKKDTQWHNIVVWGNQVSVVQKYLQKGSEIAIEGKLTTRTYENEQGEKKYITEVRAREFVMLNGIKKVNDTPENEE